MSENPCFMRLVRQLHVAFWALGTVQGVLLDAWAICTESLHSSFTWQNPGDDQVRESISDCGAKGRGALGVQISNVLLGCPTGSAGCPMGSWLAHREHWVSHGNLAGSRGCQVSHGELAGPRGVMGVPGRVPIGSQGALAGPQECRDPMGSAG